MELKQGLSPSIASNGDGPRARAFQLWRTDWLRRTVLVLFASFALVAGTATAGQQSSLSAPDAPYQISAANEPPNAGGQAKMSPVQTQPNIPETAEMQRKKQLATESEQLLALATALKAEVDKTNKDMLSLRVIRKADEIEKLAHTVKEKMKVTATDH